MKKGRLKKGFTIIEVALFLAISAAILVAIMSNTSRTVARRRYNDDVQNFVEQIRTAYSATINVENYRRKTEDSSYFCSVSAAFRVPGRINSLTANSPIDQSVSDDKKIDNYPGRTGCAIYGQVITFGEGGSSDIHRYDLIGFASTDKINIEKDSDEALAALRAVGANIVTMTQVPVNVTNPTNCRASIAGTQSLLRPQWTGQLENRKNRKIYKGAIMIARSPISGTVHTYVYSAYGNPAIDNPESDKTFEVQQFLNVGNQSCVGFKAYMNDYAATTKWVSKDLDLCVGSEDLYANGDKRRAIRIHADGSTESSVELLTEVDSEPICNAN